jgi:succinate dehydrogenase/fumarate reductase iron-sulfur protein
VPLDKGVTVFGLLNYIRKNLDESVAYKIYCTNQQCGECGLILNGKPVLACHAIIEADHVVLEPLASFPVVKDLVVDTDSMLKKQWADLPPMDGLKRNWAFLTEDEQNAFFMAGRCIGCSICQSICPMYKEDQQVLAGPGFYVALSQYLLRAGTEKEMEKVLTKAVQHDILKCTGCENCSENCPQGIDPFKVIAIISKLIPKNHSPLTNYHSSDLSPKSSK